MKFTRPVKINDTLTVRLEILEAAKEPRAHRHPVFNQNDELVVDGEAEVLARASETVELKELPPISIG